MSSKVAPPGSVYGESHLKFSPQTAKPAGQDLLIVDGLYSKVA